MSKRFQECSLLLPPSLQDWSPEDHLAGFIAEVAETFDLGEIYAHHERKYGEKREKRDSRLTVSLFTTGRRLRFRAAEAMYPIEEHRPTSRSRPSQQVVKGPGLLCPGCRVSGLPTHVSGS